MVSGRTQLYLKDKNSFVRTHRYIYGFKNPEFWVVTFFKEQVGVVACHNLVSVCLWYLKIHKAFDKKKKKRIIL